MIYFSGATKTLVLENIAKQMPDDGLLFLGGAETVLGLTEAFRAIPNRRGLYAKDGSVHLGGEASDQNVKALA